ncbi:MAG: DUF2232 domain-containing protein [Ruminococcaceae bacterium]|nr:DUF2232 domain-containing protein [Oscillospiraceae bacterium]
MVKQNIFFIIKAAVTVAVSYLAAAIPGAFIPGALVLGVLLVAWTYSQSYGKTALLGFLSLASIGVGVFSGRVDADFVCRVIYNFLIICGGGTAIGIALKTKRTFVSLLSVGTLTYLSSFLVWIVKDSVIGKINFIDEYINKPVALFFETYTQLLTASGTQNFENILAVTGDLQWVVQQTLAMIVPSFFIICCASLCYVVFSVGRKIIVKFYGSTIEGYPEFSQIRLPKSVSAVLSVLFIISFFTGNSVFAGAIANIIIILSFVYIVYGLSIVEFFFKKTRLRFFIRFITYIIAFAVSGFASLILPVINAPMILLMLGITDSMFDFRKLKGGNSENEQNQL